MSKKKSKQSFNQTQTTTPKPPGWLRDPYENFAGKIGSFIDNDPKDYTTGASAAQQEAFGRVGGRSNFSDPYEDAVSRMNDISSRALEAPDKIEAHTVSPKLLRDADLSGYMDPYEKDVIDASRASYRDLLNEGVNVINSRAGKGAFGGSRHGVAVGELVADATRDQAQFEAGLRSNNHNRAQELAFRDIGNQYNADVYNAGAKTSADRYNEENRLRNEQFAQQAAQNLASAALSGDANARAEIDQLLGVGAVQRAIEQEDNPEIAQLKLMREIAQLLGTIPGGLFTGTTSTGSGSSKGSSSGFSVGLELGDFSFGGA